MEKTVERPQSQIVEQIDEIPETRTDVGTQTSEKAVETPQLHVVEKIVEIFQVQTGQSTQTFESVGTAPFCQLTLAVDVPVVVQRQVPSIEIVQKTVEVPQTQHIDKVADVPVARPRHRVANELGGRNCVTGERRKNKLPSRLD